MKIGEMKEKGKGGIVSLNIKKPKRPKIIKERSLSEVLKTAQPQKEKRLEKIKEGVVKWFSYRANYGFIFSGENNQDYFFHHSQVNNKDILSEGDEVSFNAEKDPKGWRAININKRSIA